MEYSLVRSKRIFMSLFRRAVKRPEGWETETEIGDSAVKLVWRILLFILIIVAIGSGGVQWLLPTLSRLVFLP